MASKEEIDRLIAATDMVKLVSPYTKLEKSGSGYKGLCPFHEEKTPSFHVSQEKKVCKCFGCGKGGNPITFLMDIKHLNYREAVLELANINNMKIDLGPGNEPNYQFQKYYEINEFALKVFEKNLWETKDGKLALDYLHQRGLTDEDIKIFKIGLAPSQINLLYLILKEAGYLELDMLDVGLIRESNDKYYDVFTNRLIFPILDQNNKILGFSGRIYRGEKDTAKYMNTADTPIFKKNTILYNLNNAIKEIESKGEVVLHEGFMDVIASYRSGIKNVVCSMGTQLTLNQIKLIKRFTKQVVICFDADNAGEIASTRAVSMFEQEGFKIKLLRLKDVKDPDEFVLKFGKKAYYDYFNKNLIDPLTFKYESLVAKLDINDLNSVEEFKREIFLELQKKRSVSLVEHFIKKMSENLGISTAALYVDYDHLTSKNTVPNRAVVNKNFDAKVKKIVLNKLYELRIFEYAKKDKLKAIYIDSFLETNNALIAFEEKNREIWILLINTYYHYNEVFDEQKFLVLLNDNKLFNYYYNNAVTLEKINIPFNDNDLEACLQKFVSVSKEKRLKLYQDELERTNDYNQGLEILKEKFAYRKKIEKDRRS